MEANWKFLALSLAMSFGGAAVLFAGSEYNDATLTLAGWAALVGAAVVAGIGLRGLVGFGNAPRSAAGSRRRTLKHFWAPAADPRRPATDDQIARVQRTLNVTLPRTHVRLLKVQDGGEPRYALWAPPVAPEHDCRAYQVDAFLGTEEIAIVTQASIRNGYLPRGVACIAGYPEDDWQLCLDYRARPAGGEPAVVAFDAEQNCFGLAGSFDAFLADLTRPLGEFVYAPQGVVGKAADGLLMDLAKVPGVELRPSEKSPQVFVAEHPRWRSPSGRPARFELRVNAAAGQAGRQRDRMFPETWSYRVLYCDVDEPHRQELEQSLARGTHKWVLVSVPARQR